MDTVPAVTVPLRGGKKMKKRKELDALVAHTVTKRASGLSSHDQLLSDSSDEWTPAVGANSRGRRGRLASRNRICSIATRACSVLFIFTCAVATTTVMWLFIDVRQQVTSLRTELNQVVAAHRGVPDALQECHSLSRELQKNQSIIMERLTGFSLMLGNFSVNMSDLRSALSVVQQQLKASPSLLNDPRLIKDLPESVAKFGSKIQDLQSTATALKEQDSRLDAILTGLTGNLTDLRAQVSGLTQTRDGVSSNELAAEKSALMAVISQISANVTNLNNTLSNKLQWTVTDQVKDHKALGDLQEMNQNVTARLKTLETLFVKESTPPAATSASSATDAAAAASPTNVQPTPSPAPQISSSP